MSSPQAKNTVQTTDSSGGGDGGKKKLKPCCACPETKQARDECVVLFGEENCGKLIEAHKKCMRDLGFEI